MQRIASYADDQFTAQAILVSTPCLQSSASTNPSAPIDCNILRTEDGEEGWNFLTDETYDRVKERVSEKGGDPTLLGLSRELLVTGVQLRPTRSVTECA